MKMPEVNVQSALENFKRMQVEKWADVTGMDKVKLISHIRL